MLRISTSADERGAVIRLEGKLRAAWVPEVRTAIAGVSGAFRMDLQGLSFADADGVDLLRELSASGVTIVGASPLITELLANSLRRIR